MNEEKYLRNGKAVCVIEELNNGFLVQDVYESNEGDYLDGQIYFVDKVFNSAPAVKQHKQIAELENKIRDLLASEKEIKCQIEKAKTENEKLLKRFEQFKQLRYLNYFLDGKITHFVEIRYTPRIIEFDKIRCEEDKRDLKLLTLFGKSNGDLQWKINTYRDGSGGDTVVIPCISYEQALAELQKYVDMVIASAQEPNSRIVDLTKEYPVNVPNDYIIKYKQLMHDRIINRIAENEKEKEKMLAELNQLEQQ